MYSGNPSVPGMTYSCHVLQVMRPDCDTWEDIIHVDFSASVVQLPEMLAALETLNAKADTQARLILRVETVLS